MLDTLSELFTATKHGNGRDWWIVLQRNYNRYDTPPPLGEKAKYHKYLLDPTGIQYMGAQAIGKLWTPETWAGQSCFSPDGARYAIGNPYNGINLFRFDRCSGELFDPIHLDFSSDTTYSMGIAFSPNSRYMYATTGKYLFQYDMEAPDIPASKLAVAEYDGFLSPFPASFYQLALAPDGKIYGTAPNGSNVLHIIHQPDEPGLNCMVQQHGLQLPTYHSYTTPNVPHYRLGRLVGSACDSLGISATVQPWQNAGKMSIAPNPSDDVIVVSNADMEEGLISLYDLSGKLWLTQKVTEAQGSVTLTVKAIPAGVYFLQFKGDSGKTSNGKLVIQH